MPWLLMFVGSSWNRSLVLALPSRQSPELGDGRCFRSVERRHRRDEYTAATAAHALMPITDHPI